MVAFAEMFIGGAQLAGKVGVFTLEQFGTPIAYQESRAEPAVG